MVPGWVNTCDCMSYALSATAKPYWEKFGRIGPSPQYGAYKYLYLEQVTPFIKMKLVVNDSLEIELTIKPLFKNKDLPLYTLNTLTS